MLYGHKIVKESALTVTAEAEELKDVDLKPFVELMAYDDISRGSDEEIKSFCESEVASVLMEKQVLSKPTMMRLSKDDDERRRTKLAVYQLARESGDPHWKKMIAYRQKWKEERAILIKKYGSKASKIAKASQREYVKAARKMQATPEVK